MVLQCSILDTTKKDCKNINWKDQECPDANCVKVSQEKQIVCNQLIRKHLILLEIHAPQLRTSRTVGLECIIWVEG